MVKLNTEEDVRKWAEMIVDGKGEKFTPLSKGDQYVIARFIVKAEQESTSAETVPQAEEDKGTAEPPSPPDPPEATPETKHEIETDLPPPATATMTRSFAYHRAGYSVQQAYDEFLKWAADHPHESHVMDFSNGKQSTDAAFAYWLGEVITIDVYAQYMRR